MALFNPELQEQIKDFFCTADSDTLNTFRQGTLVDENECTTHFTSAVRERFSQNFPLQMKSYSQKLPPNLERRWGVDGLILLVDHESNLGKICLFEAKTDRNNWDYIKKGSVPPVSHFSTQLKRQKIPNARGFVVWEQIYTAAKENSSCFLHDTAIEHKGDPTYEAIWCDADVEEACKLQQEKGMPVTVGEIIQIACECNIGTAFSIDDIVTQLRDIPPVANAILIEKQSPELNNTLEQVLEKRFPGNKKEIKQRRAPGR